MNRRDFLKNIVILSIVISSQLSVRSAFARLAGEAQKNSSRPNIVFILADDFGYSSLNSYGADKDLVRTPHIDRIAEKGMRFTDASTPASICTPTRYGFLTGRYPWRSWLKSGVVNPNDPLLPNPDRVTVADWLKERGYNTAAIGKWHLGYGQGERAKRTDYLKWSPGPLDLGFDYHFGVPNNHGDGFNVFIENDHIYGLRSNRIQPYSKSFYGRPYSGFDAPQRENKKTMSDLTDKTVEWLKQQSNDKPFFLYFGAVAVHHPITPSDHMRGMSNSGPYGDFIQDLDMSTGRILETLEYMNLMDNTIVIFSSDNGGDIPGKGADRPENQAIAHGLKINGDLRGDKHTIFEGGTRVPFIVSWPGKVEENSVSNDMINLVDIFATICEITDGKLPNSKNVAPDSFSFLPSLTRSKKTHQRTSMITADAKGMHAIRRGNWKYIDNTLPQGNKKGKPQLYDLAADPSESVNLYDKKYGIAKKLLDELNRFRKVKSTR